MTDEQTETPRRGLSAAVQTAVDEHLAATGGGFSQGIIGLVQYINSEGQVMNLMIEPAEQAISHTLGFIKFLGIWADVYARQQIINCLSGHDDDDEDDE